MDTGTEAIEADDNGFIILAQTYSYGAGLSDIWIIKIDSVGKILWDKSKPDVTLRKKLDTSILQKLGWEASTNLGTGILKTINSYKSELLNNKIRK